MVGTQTAVKGPIGLKLTVATGKNVPLVTDVERPPSHSTPRSDRSARVLRRVMVPVMTLVTVLASTVVLATRPASGDSIASARATAAAIENELTAAQNQMSALSQQYDEAASHLQQINTSIATTKATITADEKQVSTDRTRLSKAAIANYVTDGSASSDNPIFSGNEKTVGAATEYNQIASGDIDLAVANLHTAENTLTAQQAQLQAQQGQAQQAVNAEQAAVTQNAQEIQAQKSALAQENGQIADLVRQQQEQAVQAATRVTAARVAEAQTISSSSSFNNTAAAPPTASGGQGAVQAAESQEGVPYVWGGESPKGSSNPGFDCSGLTSWSWGQVGVGLPHYSGAQMSDSAPVPLGDLEPGDLLFYGPGGSEHVAMYVSAGLMIEAPETGQSVHVTGLRLGDGFVGAGRP
jgi:peptidoglycan DL-endopeptidase CwlO